MKNNIYEIGKKLDIAKDEVKSTLVKRKKIIIVGTIVVAALAFVTNIYYLGARYGGISVDDLRFLERFPILRALFGRFFM